MKLSESKLFAIEALNRIDGFEWPDGGLLASASKKTKHVVFWAAGNIPLRLVENGTEFDTELCIKYKREYWNNSLITRAEFESVDGWVRHNNGEMPVVGGSLVQVKVQLHSPAVSARLPASEFNWKDGGVEYWRYARPQKQAKQLTTQPTHNIESLISQHKAARLSTLEARRQLERAEAIEHSLLLSIEEWAESQGFDIRLLDESEEKPELVITDWRDLRVGDVIEIDERADGWFGLSGVQVVVNSTGKSESDITLLHCQLGIWRMRNGTKWKFIRRPAK